MSFESVMYFRRALRGTANRCSQPTELSEQSLIVRMKAPKPTKLFALDSPTHSQRLDYAVAMKEDNLLKFFLPSYKRVKAHPRSRPYPDVSLVDEPGRPSRKLNQGLSLNVDRFE